MGLKGGGLSASVCHVALTDSGSQTSPAAGKFTHGATWAAHEWASRTGGRGEGRGGTWVPPSEPGTQGGPRFLLRPQRGFLQSVGGPRRVIRVLDIWSAALTAWMLKVKTKWRDSLSWP